MSESEPRPEPTISEQLDTVKLAAIHVYVIKLLAAPAPTSMPPAFAEALGMLRLIEREG